MSDLNITSSHQSQIHTQHFNTHKNPSTKKQTDMDKKTTAKETPGDSYSTNNVKNTKTYKVDLDKVRAMKEEADLRMLELFQHTARQSTQKQIAGLRGNSETKTLNIHETLSIEYTAEDVAKAQDDIAPGGYWSAENTAERLVEFAKSLSGGDPEKIEMLKEAFDKGFKEIENMFGGTLPDLSYNTYSLTMEKFNQWADES